MSQRHLFELFHLNAASQHCFHDVDFLSSSHRDSAGDCSNFKLPAIYFSMLGILLIHPHLINYHLINYHHMSYTVQKNGRNFGFCNWQQTVKRKKDEFTVCL